jgi:hypothetical protein
MHDTLTRDKKYNSNNVRTQKMAPNKEKELNGGQMEFINNMGDFHAHFFFLSDLFLKMKTTKRREGHSSCYSHFQPKPSSNFMHESLLNPKKTKNDT